MPHKTLLIGLGTSGAQIVSGVIDRVTARFGSLDNAPWLQVVAFDTDRIQSTTSSGKGLSVADTGNAVHVGLPSADFQNFKLNPAQLSNMDFEEWADPNVFQAAAASDQGAGNVRMIGRASLLYPSIFATLHRHIDQRLNTLRNLPLQQSAQQAGITLTPPVSETSFWIYVCGSLTGGTCSGSFIDIGYYLRELQQNAESFSVYGIFGLPHPQAGSPRHKANAFSALQELNHYLSDGALYEQRFPLPMVFPNPIRKVAETPYRASMLVIPRAPDGPSMNETYAAVSEFLATAATTPMSDAVYARVVDPAAAFYGMRSRGRHMNFQSLGAAVLEFPADHIARACGCHLIEGAFEEWLAQPGISPDEASALLNVQKVDRDRIRKRLLVTSTGEADLEQAIRDRIGRAAQSLASGNAGAAASANAQIEEAFKSNPPLPDGLGPYKAFKLINENAPLATDEFLAAFRNEIEEAVATIERGPNWCLGYAKAVLDRCDTILKEATAPERHEAVAAREGTMKRKEELLRETASSALLKGTRWQKTALRKYSEEWAAAARANWQLRLEEAGGPAERRLVEALRGEAQRVVDRIQGHELALKPLIAKIEASAREEHKRLNGTGPTTNGHVIFSPGATVAREFTDAMGKVAPVAHPWIRPIRSGEAYARAFLLTEWSLLKGSLTAAVNESPFDPRVNANDQTEAKQVNAHRDTIALSARRSFFEDLFTRDVLVELFGAAANPNANAAAIVSSVEVASQAFIQVNDNDNPLGPIVMPDPRTPSFAFYPQATSQLWPYQTFSNLIAGTVPPNNRVPSSDSTRVLLLQTRTTFPADALTAVASYESFLPITLADGAAPRLDSRRDIAWRKMDGSPLHPNIDEGMGLFLLSLAIGKSTARSDRPGFILTYDNRQIRLKPDVELAGLLVAQSNDIRAFLRRERDRLAQSATRGTLVSRIRTLITTHSAVFPTLTYHQQPLTEGFVEAKLMETMRPVPELLKQYLALHGTRYSMRPQDYMFESDELPVTARGQKRPTGFYCDNSACYLHLGEPAMSADTFPEKCPNCQKQLLMPGYHEIERSRRVAVGTTPSTPPSGEINHDPVPPVPDTFGEI